MGSSLRDRCGPAARALMLSAILALAWLVWGAGTADAAPGGPGSGPDAGPIQEVPFPVVPPAPTVAVLAGTAVPVLNQSQAAVPTGAASAAAVLTSAAPVLASASPVLNPAADVIGAVSGALPASLPVPAVVPAMVTLPAPTGNEDRPATAPHVALPKGTTAGTGPRPAGSGLTAARLPVGAAAVGAWPAVDEHPAPASSPDASLDPDQLPWLSALQGPTGSSSGPGAGLGAGGAQTAGDAAGSWNPLDARSNTPAPDIAQAPAAGPSFDPGSSPD